MSDAIKRLLSQIRGRAGLTLQRRLFAFLAVFLVALMSGLFLVLFSSGVFSAGTRESRVFLENEIGHISAAVEKEFGTLAVEGVALSEKIGELIEKRLPEGGIAALSGESEILGDILESASEPLLAALVKNKTSGVFLVLDATVNPSLPGSENSRSGLYFKNMEPNAINVQAPAVRFLRGPAAIARSLGYAVLPQWTMEFGVEPGDFFRTATDAARGGELALSRLYYWNPACMLRGDYEHTMLLTVPLVAQDGSVLGVCGFEVSAMLFKLQNSPDNSTYTRVFAMLAPLGENGLEASDGLFAGSYAAMSYGVAGTFSVYQGRDGFSGYSDPEGSRYTGLHREVRLYPKNAAFEGQRWAVAVMMPEDNLSAYISVKNRPILYLLAALLLLSLVAAFLISRSYIAPVLTAIDDVKSGSLTHKKTNIREIDDLFAFLAERDAEADASREHIARADTSTLYEAFIRSIETLSPAERSVFNLYVEGYDAKKITEILCLSINTIKTHNRRIYQKLGVSSRKELLVYAGMMREKGTIPT